jgi:hypothetical protein
MKSKFGHLAIILFIAFVSWGHVGDSNVFFEGNAGPYPVRVIIRPPGVVPGLADITVRVHDDDVQRVTVRPVRWDVGTEGAPPPDETKPVRGDTHLYTAELWLMTRGSYSVHINVNGAKGSGTVVVPILSLSTRRLDMPKGMGLILLGLGAFLFIGGLTIVNVAVRESVLTPGETPDSSRRRRARWATVVATLIFLLLLTGGKRWWDSADARHLRRMYKPLDITTATRVEASHRIIRLTIDDLDWARGRWPPLVPDHGKLMHLFIIREPELDGFAHIHPVSLDESRFDVVVPSSLPAGRYRIYADITHESGFAQTLTDTVEIPTQPDTPARDEVSLQPDPDDSWSLASPFPTRIGKSVFPFPDGSAMTWERGEKPLVVRQEVSLRFIVRTPDGSPAPLEPYMGMLSHAAILLDDGAVFVHLHPTGTISMAAQQIFESRALDNAPEMSNPHSGMKEMNHSQHAAVKSDGVVSFPYQFSQPGRYRIWVQVKRDGAVLTGVFDAEVGKNE